MSASSEAAAEFRRLYDEMQARTLGEMERVAEAAADRAIEKTLKMLGVRTEDPFEAQRQFMTLREITDKVWDPEYRKDMEFARTWRKTMENEDGVPADLRHARRSRKFWDAALSKGSMTAIGILVTGAISVWWRDLLSVIHKAAPP